MRAVRAAPGRRDAALLLAATATAAAAAAPAPARAAGRGGAGNADGRVAVVTGANSGIGRAMAEGLARQGFRVVPACRTAAKAEATAEQIRQAVPGADCVALDRGLELASLASVTRYADELLASGLPVALLVNNAGLAWCAEAASEDGHELQFAVSVAAVQTPGQGPAGSDEWARGA